MLAAALRVVDRDNVSDAGVFTTKRNGDLFVDDRSGSILRLLKATNSNCEGVRSTTADEGITARELGSADIVLV